MLTWNVFVGNFNTKSIEVYNIFKHSGFIKSCRKALIESDGDDRAFLVAVNRELRYYFWSKCEYEVIISGWPPSDTFNDSKVDIYAQVCMNWSRFAAYLLDYKDELLRGEDE